MKNVEICQKCYKTYKFLAADPHKLNGKKSKIHHPLISAATSHTACFTKLLLQHLVHPTS